MKANKHMMALFSVANTMDKQPISEVDMKFISKSGPGDGFRPTCDTNIGSLFRQLEYTGQPSRNRID